MNAVSLRIEGGGGRFLFEGVFARLISLEPRHEYIVFVHANGAKLVREILDRQAMAEGKTSLEPRVRMIVVPSEDGIFAWRDHFDLYFCPMNTLRPRLLDRPTVAMLLDIQEQYRPEYFTSFELIARNEVYPELCRAATIVVTISQFNKQCIIEKFGIDPRKIDVIHLAPQDRLVDRDRQDDGKWTRRPIPRPFFFYPSNCYPHKNHALLLEAADKMPPPQSGGPCFVFSGFELPGGFPLHREISDRKLTDRCFFFSGLSADEMRYLFRATTAVVLPTMFEGFGIPAVEAIACGSPLVCSDIPALREVAADNALYFEPGNLESLCAGLRKITSDAPLRSRMIDAGYLLARKYTWDAAAQKMLGIFEQAQTRFKFGNSGESITARQPRIGLLIRRKQGGERLEKTLQSIAETGYPNLAVCVATTQEHGDSFKNPAIPIEYTPESHSEAVSTLLDFAQRQKLDLVGEILEGNTVVPSAPDSLALSFVENSSCAVHLGEARQWARGRLVDVSRMRILNEKTWKMEGLLFPEMVFLSPGALTRWPAGSQIVQQSEPHWRWRLLQAAGPQNQLTLLRRTLADCELRTLGSLAGLKAFRAGMSEIYRRSDGQQMQVRLIRRFEGTARKLSLLLPARLQYWGTKLWYRLSRSSASGES